MNMMISYQELVRTFPNCLMSIGILNPFGFSLYWWFYISYNLKSIFDANRLFIPLIVIYVSEL